VSIRRFRILGALLLALSLSACDGEMDPVDGGPDLGDAGLGDGGQDPDTGVMDPDTGVMDPDSGVMDPDSGVGCGADEVELRGACVPTCGADASTWNDELRASLSVVGGHCTDADALGTRVSGDAATVYELSTSATPGGTLLEIREWDWSAGRAAPPVSRSYPVTHDAESPVAPSGFVVLSPDGNRLAVGYTLQDAAFTFPGEIVVFDLSTDGTFPTALAGNFDASWFSDDALLVNALDSGRAGQAIYALSFGALGVTTDAVITDFGDYSGGVAVTPSGVVVGALATGGNELHAFRLDAVRSAIATPITDLTPADGRRVCTGCMLSSFGDAGDSVFVPARFMDEAPYAAVDISGYRVTVSGSEDPDLEAARPLTVGDSFRGVLEGPSGTLLLRFEGGLLQVREE